MCLPLTKRMQRRISNVVPTVIEKTCRYQATARLLEPYRGTTSPSRGRPWYCSTFYLPQHPSYYSPTGCNLSISSPRPSFSQVSSSQTPTRYPASPSSYSKVSSTLASWKPLSGVSGLDNLVVQLSRRPEILIIQSDSPWTSH